MSVKISSLNTASTIDSGDDITIAGNNPLTFSDWGGGWFMQDGTYIRSLNQKSIWLGDGVLASNGGLSVGYGGALPTAGYAIIAGNVGIGTSAPTNKLSITDGATMYATQTGSLLDIKVNASNGNDITSRSGLRLGNNTNAFNIWYGGTSDRLRFVDGGGTEVMSMVNGGNVLIGTTADSGYKLQVNGQILMTGTTSASAILGGIASSWGGSANYPTLYGTAAERFIMHINPHISYVVNGTNGYTGSMTGATVRFASDAAATTFWDLGVGVNSVGTDKYSIGRNGTNLLAINSSGNVGIGTASPAAKLDVQVPVETNGYSLSGYPFLKYSAGDVLDFGAFGATWSALRFLTNGAERMRITAAGSILMNTTSSPTTGGFTNTTLSVKQLADGLFGGGLHIEENGTTSLAYFGFDGNTFRIGTSYRTTGDYRPISFATSGTERLRIANYGNVLIGDTTDAGYKLYVNGTGLFNGVVNSYATMDNLGRRINSPEGASYITSTSSVTGAIKIKLPVARNNSSTMMMFRVKIYQYNTGNSHEFQIGGYNYGLGNWYNPFVTNLTDDGSNFSVRFGTDATSDCVWIGETSSSWVYPQVFVTDFQAGYGGQGIEWATGWAISFETAFDTVELSRLASQVITSRNIGSQSVSYATTASALTSMNISQFTNNSGYITSAALSGYALVGHTHDLGRYSLQAPAYIDGLTTTNFRSTLFGLTSNTFNISTARWNTTPTALPGMNSYGTMLAWSGADTQGFIATDYSTANITVGGGNASNISWSALLLHSSNYGSYALPLTGGNLTGLVQSTANIEATAFRTDGNFELTSATTGLKSNFYDTRFYAESTAYWTASTAAASTSGALLFRQGFGSTLKGYVYWDSSGFGLLNNTGGWSVRANNGSNYGGTLFGNWVVRSMNVDSGSIIFYTSAGVTKGSVTWDDQGFGLINNQGDYSVLCNQGSSYGGLLRGTWTSIGNFNIIGAELSINSNATSTYSKITYRSSLDPNSYDWYTGMNYDPTAEETYYYIRYIDGNQFRVYPDGTIYINGGAFSQYSATGNYISVAGFGLYSANYSSYIRTNTTTSSYGAWDVTGAKGGYTGFVYNTMNLPHVMFDVSNGNGGLYYQTGSRWVLYYSYGNNSLGIGGTTTDATYKLYVNGNVRVVGTFNLSTLITNGAVYSIGGGLTNTNPSDIRLKEDISPLQYGLKEVMALNPVTYKWKDGSNGGQRSTGLIAQDVKEVMPDYVKNVSEDSEYLGLDSYAINIVLINAIKELKAEIEILKNK